MIDIENIVFDAVYTAVKTSYSDAEVYGEYIEVPAAFPCVTVVETDNYTHTRTQDTELREHHANVVYDVNVYANDATKKSTAKAIADIVDTAFQDMKFTRTFKDSIPNQDRTIYRIALRFEGLVGRSFEDGTDTKYPMYRRHL